MLLYNCPKGIRAITRKGERRTDGSHERERNQNCEKLNYLRNSLSFCKRRERGLQERRNPRNARQNRISERTGVTGKTEKGGRHKQPFSHRQKKLVLDKIVNIYPIYYYVYPHS